MFFLRGFAEFEGKIEWTGEVTFFLKWEGNKTAKLSLQHKNNKNTP